MNLKTFAVVSISILSIIVESEIAANCELFLLDFGLLLDLGRTLRLDAL